VDGLDFDALTRAVSAVASRRQALRLLALSALTAGLPRRAFAAPARQGDGCAPGLTYCEEQPSWAPAGCYDLASDYLHCGDCMHQCPSAGPVPMACIGGVCVATGCGDLTDCTGNLDCTDLAWDANNCGACGNVCASGVCETGVCAGGCGEGLAYCPARSDGQLAGCYDLFADYFHCGSCDVSCPTAGGPSTCSAGQCVATGCAEGFTDGTGNLGCVDLASDPNNCGVCGVACESGVCEAGGCAPGDTTCAAGLAYCPAKSDPVSQEAGCYDLASDYTHCGSCDISCPIASPGPMACIAGQCQHYCEEGLTLCEAPPYGYYCADLGSSNTDCGACVNACAEGEDCVGGACVASCEAGLTSCNGSCVDVTADPHHCGACGVFGGGGICGAGTCAPDDAAGAAGLAYCPFRSDGQPAGCYDLSTDYWHCGSCDMSCPTAGFQGVCSGGECVDASCAEGLTYCTAQRNGLQPGCYDLSSDRDHCGACENACESGACEAGVCVQQAAQTAAEDAEPAAATTPADRSAGGQESARAAGSDGGGRGNRSARPPRAKDKAAGKERQGAAPARAGAAAPADAALAWPFDEEAGQWTIVHGYRARDAGGGDDFMRFALMFAVCPKERIDAAGACDLGDAENEPDGDREATQGSPIHSPVDGAVAWTEGDPSCLTVAIDVADHPGSRLALFNVEGRLERGQAVKQGKRIGKVSAMAQGTCEGGGRIRMALYRPRAGAADDPVEGRQGVPFADDWAIAGCDYPDDGRTAEQYRGELAPCPAEDEALAGA
jgi:hypothetical protein